MPRAVKISGWIGLVFSGLWLIVSAVGLANPPDPEFDGLVVQFLLAGAVGVILSLGLMRRELWAFRTFVAFIWLTVAIFSCYMCVAKSIGQVAWAGVFAVALLLWRFRLTTKEVRTFFGLPPEPQFLLAPAWVNLSGGVASVAALFLPQPTPAFGFWLESWQAALLNLAFGFAFLWAGWGMLRAKPWMKHATIAVCIASIGYSVAMAWDPNPKNRLGSDLAMTRLGLVVGIVFGLLWTAWALWRIHLHNRQRLT